MGPTLKTTVGRTAFSERKGQPTLSSLREELGPILSLQDQSLGKELVSWCQNGRSSWVSGNFRIISSQVRGYPYSKHRSHILNCLHSNPKVLRWKHIPVKGLGQLVAIYLPTISSDWACCSSHLGRMAIALSPNSSMFYQYTCIQTLDPGPGKTFVLPKWSLPISSNWLTVPTQSKNALGSQLNCWCSIPHPSKRL